MNRGVCLPFSRLHWPRHEPACQIPIRSTSNLGGDIFEKVGWARTHTTASGALSCAPPALCILALSADRTDSDFAYGAESR